MCFCVDFVMFFRENLRAADVYEIPYSDISYHGTMRLIREEGREAKEVRSKVHTRTRSFIRGIALMFSACPTPAVDKHPSKQTRQARIFEKHLSENI